MATTKEMISKAVAAHGMWKTRLKSAIASGTLDMPVETIRQDNQCAFGKWLYGQELSAQDKATSHYRTVKALHADFHRAAARVAELALSGSRAEAQKLMALDGEFTSASAKLTQAMMDWQKACG